MQKFAVVYFPNINLDKINTIREKYDPNWNLIPPHITLVFPLSDISENQLLEHIDTISKNFRPFSIHLTGLTKSFDDYLFLLVKEGNDDIIRLHKKLYSGLLIPYSQNNPPFIPHITLGFFRAGDNDFDDKLYNKAFKEVEEMNLDLSCDFNCLSLIEGNGVTPPEIVKNFNL